MQKPTLALLLVTTQLAGGSQENGAALEMSTCSLGEDGSYGYWQVQLHVPAVGYQLVSEIDGADTSHSWVLPDSTRSLFLESRDNPELVFRILGDGVLGVSRICLKLERNTICLEPGEGDLNRQREAFFYADAKVHTWSEPVLCEGQTVRLVNGQEGEAEMAPFAFRIKSPGGKHQ